MTSCECGPKISSNWRKANEITQLRRRHPEKQNDEILFRLYGRKDSRIYRIKSPEKRLIGNFMRIIFKNFSIHTIILRQNIYKRGATTRGKTTNFCFLNFLFFCSPYGLLYPLLLCHPLSFVIRENPQEVFPTITNSLIQHFQQHPSKLYKRKTRGKSPW